MNACATGATRIALLSTTGAALLVLVLYAPALEAPFLVPKFAALELAASLGMLSLVWQRATTGGARWSRPIAVGALLVVTTSLISWLAARTSPLGAPYAMDALARWGALFGVGCGASVLSDTPGEPRRVLHTVTVAAATVAGVGLLQHVGALPFSIPVFSMPGSTFGNRNLAAEVMAMSLPLGVSLAVSTEKRDARAFLGAAVGLELLFLAVTRARGAWIGAASGLVMVAWIERGRMSRRTVVGAALGLFLAGVAAALPAQLNSHDAGDAKRYGGVVTLLEEGADWRSPALRTRLGFARRSLAILADHPWLGVGPGNWPVVFPLYAEPGAADDGVLTATVAPRQAHDDLLERAAETGLPGALALVALGAGVFVAVRRRLAAPDDAARDVVIGAAGSLVTLVVLSVASFPLEMPATIALAGLSLGCVVADPLRMASPLPRGVAVPAMITAVLLLGCTGVRAERSVGSGRWLGVAERARRRDPGTVGAAEALTALARSLDASPVSFLAELRTAQMLLREGRADEARVAAEHALTIEPYSPNAWAQLGAASLAAGDPSSAVRAASTALERLHDYPFALQVRAEAERRLSDVVHAEEDWKRLQALVTQAKDDDTRRAARSLLGAPPPAPDPR